MFEQLFERPHALARQRNGPAAEERLRYLAHCAEQQMARRTLRLIALYLLIVARALRLADRPGELISRDEWGFPVIRGEVPAALAPHARRAVRACPALALRLVPRPVRRAERNGRA